MNIKYKSFILLCLVPYISNAAEIFNKDGSKVNIYGKVSANYQFSKDKNNNQDLTYARLGFKGETQISEQLIGYGQWEYNIRANNAESQGDLGNKTRLGFAGLKYGQYGSFDYGRNYGIIYDTLAYTDVLPGFGGDTTYLNDGYMTGRANGLATYRNHDFFGLLNGLDIGFQYQSKNIEDAEGATNGRTIDKAHGDGFGLSVDYHNIAGSGIGIASSFSSSDRTLGQKKLVNSSNGNKAQTWATAVKYDANQIYLAALYSETLNMTPYTITSTNKKAFAKKTKNFEVVAQYQFQNGLRPSIAYLQSKGVDLVGLNNTDLLKYFDIGVTYNFNKNIYTYIDYKINLLNTNNKLTLDTDNQVAVAFVYLF